MTANGHGNGSKENEEHRDSNVSYDKDDTGAADHNMIVHRYYCSCSYSNFLSFSSLPCAPHWACGRRFARLRA